MRLADRAEAAAQKRRAVLEALERRREILDKLVDHGQKIAVFIRSSFPRKRAGGVTFQRCQEGLGWGLEVEAFSWGVIVAAGELADLGWREGDEVGFPRQ